MKPFKGIRAGTGYCCEHCDGPFSSYKRIKGKALRKAERRESKIEIKNSKDN